jgi:hypothetical protein
VSHKNQDGDDIEFFLGFIQEGQQLFLQDRDISENFQLWLISGTPTLTGGGTANAYFTFPITLVDSGGTGTTGFANNHQLLFGTSQTLPLHAQTHAIGGSDPLTPADIGAAPIDSPSFTGTVTVTATGGNDAVNAISTTGTAIKGTATTGDGVSGYGVIGVSGEGSMTGVSGNGIFEGVAGFSNNGIGVGAISTNGDALLVETTAGTNHAKFGNADIDQSFVARVKGAFGWIRGSFTGRIHPPDTLTADRTYTLPNDSGTVALTNPSSGSQTFSGTQAFSSTTRPTSSGTGTPAATSLITATDRRTEEVSDLANVYYRQIMGHELGVWATVGISPTSVIDGNGRAGCRFIGTTGLSSASAQGGGIKYSDGGISGGSTFSLQSSFDTRFLFRNSLSSTNFDVAHFVSLRNNTNFWSASSIGLYHVAQPAATWAASTAYTVGNRINVSGIVYVCSTSGTSGLTQPTFNATINGTTNDLTAVWRTLGPHTSDKWALAFVDASSNITLTDTGVAWVAGTSNTTALRLRSNGSSVFASVNGSTEVSVSRGSLFAATPYIMCRGDSATSSRIAGLIWTVESANI